MPYQTYRLEDTAQSRSSRTIGKVKDHIKQLDIKLNQQHFSGDDFILILEFLTRFVREANINEMSEAQAYLDLPSFLQGFALSQFESVADTAYADDGGVTCWPEAVKYLLRSYATSNAVREAVLSLRDLSQIPGEVETDYSKHVNDAGNCCGNVL